MEERERERNNGHYFPSQDRKRKRSGCSCRRWQGEEKEGEKECGRDWEEWRARVLVKNVKGRNFFQRQEREQGVEGSEKRKKDGEKEFSHLPAHACTHERVRERGQ